MKTLRSWLPYEVFKNIPAHLYLRISISSQQFRQPSNTVSAPGRVVRRQKEGGRKEGSEGGGGREVMDSDKWYCGSPMWLPFATPETSGLGSGSWRGSHTGDHKTWEGFFTEIANALLLNKSFTVWFDGIILSYKTRRKELNCSHSVWLRRV